MLDVFNVLNTVDLGPAGGGAARRRPHTWRSALIAASEHASSPARRRFFAMAHCGLCVGQSAFWQALLQ
jgi:hypothetical protein